MSQSPLWFRRLLVGGVSTLTVGAMGLTGLLTTAGTAGATSSFKITQLAGTDRFGTAAAIATAAFPSGANTVIVASGLNTNLPDSLAASYLAAQQTDGATPPVTTGAPVLLVNADSVPAATTTALTSLKPKNIIIVGGTGAVTAAVQTTLSNGGTITVTRVAGANRFLTADMIDSQTGFKAVGTLSAGANMGKKTAIIADGVDANLVDALGASPLAGAGPFPMFLVNGATGTLSSTDLSILAADGITNAIIVGGTSAVGSQVGTQLTNANITNVTEAGSDRSGTSLALANYEIANDGFSTTKFNIAGGGQPNLVDALAGGPLGAQEKAPTLITDSPSNGASVITFATNNQLTEATANLFGGSDAVSATTEAAIKAAAQAMPTGASKPPTLMTASISGTSATGGTTVQYVFDESLTGGVLGAATLFHVYTASDATPSPYSGMTATLDSVNSAAVNVVYPTLITNAQAAMLALATVSSGAVTPPQPASPAPAVGPNPAGSAPIGTAGVAAPTLTTVTITQTGTSPATYEGQYTFSEPVTTASIVPGDLHLYDADGTELTCTVASPATTNTTTGPAIINCTTYGSATALQVMTAKVGTVDAGAVKGTGHPDSTTNPEGAKGSF